MQNHVRTRAPSPREYAPELPEEIERAVLRALEKSPDERFATTAEFKAAIDQCDLKPGEMPVQIDSTPPDSRETHPTGRWIEATRVMLGAEETSESPTIDRARPTVVDATALAEFIATGARLLYLKSRALLPQPEADEEPEEDLGDPLHEARIDEKAQRTPN